MVGVDGAENVKERSSRDAERDFGGTSHNLVSECPDVYAAPPGRHTGAALRVDVHVGQRANALDGFTVP